MSGRIRNNTEFAFDRVEVEIVLADARGDSLLSTLAVVEGSARAA